MVIVYVVAEKLVSIIPSGYTLVVTRLYELAAVTSVVNHDAERVLSRAVAKRLGELRRL